MLQTLLMMIMFAANLVQAAFNGQEEKRELSLDAEGVEALDIEAGAGSLDITGIAGTGRILVVATIEVPDADADEARQVMETVDYVYRLPAFPQAEGPAAKLRMWPTRDMIRPASSAPETKPTE